MNFYDLIAKYKYLSNNKLEENRATSNDITMAINDMKGYLNYLASKPRISPYIAGCSGISMFFCAMFTYLFGLELWIIFVALGTILTGIGYYQEKKQEDFKQHKMDVYKYFTDLNGELNNVRLEEQYLKSLVNDVRTCCNYYLYLVDDATKSLPVDIDLEEVFESKCLLSTFLDKFYTGKLEDFKKLPSYEKKYAERTNRIYARINQVRYPNGEEQPVTTTRRRRNRIVYPQDEIKTLDYSNIQKRF